MNKKTIFFLFLAAGAVLYAWCWLWMTEATAEDLPPLRNGDLLFQTTETSQNTAVMLASGSFYSHVGIVRIDQWGQPFIAEAANPVREVSLKHWLRQGMGGRLTLKRFKQLQPEAGQRVVQAAMRYYGRPYDFMFLFGEDAIYCSELAYHAFKRGTGITLGAIQKVRDLNVDNFAVKQLIQQRWEGHPVCKERRAADFEACYDIIMSQELVTPASIAADPRLELLYTNYPFLE